jgi:hypothetical protein
MFLPAVDRFHTTSNLDVDHTIARDSTWRIFPIVELVTQAQLDEYQGTRLRGYNRRPPTHTGGYAGFLRRDRRASH